MSSCLGDLEFAGRPALGVRHAAGQVLADHGRGLPGRCMAPGGFVMMPVSPYGAKLSKARGPKTPPIVDPAIVRLGHLALRPDPRLRPPDPRRPG